MKTGKLFTIDVELAEKLININASALVNTLLSEHFELKHGKNSKKEEKIAVLNSITKKKRSLIKRSRSLMNGIHLTWIIFLKGGFKHALKFHQDLKSKTISREDALELLQNHSKLLSKCQINMENF